MNKSTSNTSHQRLGRLSLASFGLLSRSLSSLRCFIALVIAPAPLVEVHPDIVRGSDYRRSDGRHKFPVVRAAADDWDAARWLRENRQSVMAVTAEVAVRVYTHRTITKSNGVVPC